MTQSLNLGMGLDYATLRSPDGPAQVDHAFMQWLTKHNPEVLGQLQQARESAPAESADLSALLIAVATEMDAFIGELFGIGDAVDELTERHAQSDPVLKVKYKFIKRQALLGIEPAEREKLDAPQLRDQLIKLEADPDDELQFAQQLLGWQAQAKSKEAQEADKTSEAVAAVEVAKQYAAWAAGTETGRLRHRHGVLFRHAQSIEPESRVEFLDTQSFKSIPVHTVIEPARHHRDGFSLTDPGFGLGGAVDQAKYCLICHPRGKDSCSHGIAGDKDSDERYKISAGGEALGGCPLGERISEFHKLKLAGNAVGALTMIVLDNPMVAGTGHRVCNDCMKSCIYQRQTPVDIPQSETQVLRDVLALPWGFEIYALLTRWNPLNLAQPVPAETTGKKVLVVGAGPAGYTVAHHLLNDGHDVVVIDALKIEPSRDSGEAIYDLETVTEDLASRIADGFGGVAEYGITNRWDKNFLTVIRLLLERRENYAMYSGVRFGSTITTAQAWEMGFDHVALATGAGQPSSLNIPNGLANGVRAANDFLMTLQLGGAARTESVSNLQMQLPAVIIGGGLTAMDTATESLAYYPIQVEKFLLRHERIVKELGEEAACAQWPAHERETAEQFIEHARAIRAERQRAASAGEKPQLNELLSQWGGVTVAYRKRMIDSPAYRINPEELECALAEGVRFAECASPVSVQIDENRHTSALTVMRMQRDDDGKWTEAEEVILPARAIFVATGTRPNAVVATDEPDRYSLDGDHFAALGDDGNLVSANTERDLAPVFCRHESDGRKVSFLGDAHPAFAGNVVKAMASAKHAAPQITAALADLQTADPQTFDVLTAQLTEKFTARITRVNPIGTIATELTIHAPSAAQAFKPGMLYRLQNFERLADRGIEGIALTATSADTAAGTLSFVVIANGASTQWCQMLKANDPVSLMGPTGEPTPITGKEHVLLIGGGWGNPVLASVGAALRAAGSTVVFIASYAQAKDRFRDDQIQASADHVIWSCEQGEFEPGRTNDEFCQGDINTALGALANGDFANVDVSLNQFNRLITMGSDAMMASVAYARHHTLADAFRPELEAMASINSPMQCMMKAVCAQCLQRQVDPDTGKVQFAFSCAEQNQRLDRVDFDCLSDRLAQNDLMQAQTSGWLDLERVPG